MGRRNRQEQHEAATERQALAERFQPVWDKAQGGDLSAVGDYLKPFAPEKRFDALQELVEWKTGFWSSLGLTQDSRLLHQLEDTLEVIGKNSSAAGTELANAIAQNPNLLSQMLETFEEDSLSTSEVRKAARTGVLPDDAQNRTTFDLDNLDETLQQNPAMANVMAGIFKQAGTDPDFNISDKLDELKKITSGEIDPASLLNEATPEEITAFAPLIREQIADLNPQEMLKKIGELVPEAKGIAQTISADPDLAKAFHNALVNDETMLPGLIGLAGADESDPNALSLKDIEESLQSTAFQTVGKGKLISVLNGIADPQQNMTFEDLRKLGDQTKAFANLDYGDFIRRMKEDPNGLTRDIVGMLDIQDPAMEQMLAGVFQMIMPFLQAFLDPNGFMLSPYTEFYQTHLEGLPLKLQAEGAAVLAGNDDPAETESVKKAGLTGEYKQASSFTAEDSGLTRNAKGEYDLDPAKRAEIEALDKESGVETALQTQQQAFQPA